MEEARGRRRSARWQRQGQGACQEQKHDASGCGRTQMSDLQPDSPPPSASPGQKRCHQKFYHEGHKGYKGQRATAANRCSVNRYMAYPLQRAYWIGIAVVWAAAFAYIRLIRPLQLLRRPYRRAEVGDRIEFTIKALGDFTATIKDFRSGKVV